MNKYQILIEYLGTNFKGWQIQKKGATVQGTIQEKLSKLLKQKIILNMMINVSFPLRVSDNHHIENNNKLSWIKCYIAVSNKTYPIFACEISEQVYVKPFKKFKNAEFEDLFGFKMECSDYDPNKIVWIKNATFDKSDTN